MGSAAKIYDLKYTEAMAAGLLHDIGREWQMSKILEILQRYDPDLLEQTPADCQVMSYLHGPAGAFIVQQMWGHEIRSKEVIRAIREHAGNFADMGFLSRCLHIADVLAPVRDYAGREKLAKLFMQGRIDEADLLQCHFLHDFYQTNSWTVHPVWKQRKQMLEQIVGEKPPEFFSREAA